MTQKQQHSPTIYLVSGGTGRTADYVLKAALAQFAHRARKVIGLTINTRRLVRLREARAEEFDATGAGDYIDQRDVARELQHAARLMEKHRWRKIDSPTHRSRKWPARSCG